MLLRIKNLKVEAHVGVYDWEKRAARILIFNLKLEVDAKKAASTDAIADAVDYDAVEQKVIQIAQARHYHLLESLVEETGKALVALPGVKEAQVEVDKPGALAHSESVSISGVYKA